MQFLICAAIESAHYPLTWIRYSNYEPLSANCKQRCIKVNIFKDEKAFALVVITQSVFFSQGQDFKGKIIVERINSSALQNTGGENPVRSVTMLYAE